jgi:hypothetical protein
MGDEGGGMSFIETGTLAGPMADAKPLPAGANPNLIPNLTAARWNAHRSALLDLREHTSGFVNVRSYGAKGDGVTDDTAAIQAALTAGTGRRVLFDKPTANYRVTASLSVPANTTVEGAGPGPIEIQVPAGSSFRVFDVDGVDNVAIRGFKFTKASGAALTGSAYAVSIRGAASDVLVENVHADGFVRGFQIAGGEGTTPGTVSRITMRNCRGDNSPTTFGFNVDDADHVMFENCHAAGNWLDGFKLRKATRYVTFLGGSAVGNGVGYLTDPALYTGDAIDAYAGGDLFVINSFVAEANYGTGFHIKTGDLNQDTPGDYGYVRNVQIIGARIINNVQEGLYITVSDQLDLTEPVVNAISVVGGVYQGNLRGIYVSARNVSIVGPLVRDNLEHGIVTGSRALDVEIVSPVVIGNGRTTANTYDGININGTRVAVRGGRYVGADADTIAVDGDYAAETKVTKYPVHVLSAASDVDVEIDQWSNHGSTVPVRVEMTAGRCTLRLRGSGLPTAAAYGSVGSTWTRTDAGTPEDVEWVKTSGAPNALTGWQRRVDGHGVLTRGDADLTLSAGSARTVTWTAALTADRTATLPSAALYAGIRFRVVRASASTGAFSLNVSDGSTLKALATGQWADVEYTGSAWALVGFGSL